MLGFCFRYHAGRCIVFLPDLVELGLALPDVELWWLVIVRPRPRGVARLVISIRDEMLPSGTCIDHRTVFIRRGIVALCCAQRGRRFATVLEQSSIVAFIGHLPGLTLVVLQGLDLLCGIARVGERLWLTCGGHVHYEGVVDAHVVLFDFTSRRLVWGCRVWGVPRHAIDVCTFCASVSTDLSAFICSAE